MTDHKKLMPKARWRIRATGFGAVTAITVVVCIVLFVWPVVMIVWGAFQKGYPGENLGWTLDPIVNVITSPSTAQALGSSAVLAVCVTVFGKALSFYFAWIVARTNTPWRGLITPVMLIILVLPNLFFVIAWALVGQERTGLLNQLISLLTGEPSTLVNTSSFGGIIFVGILKSVAFGYFLLLGPFRALSHRMDEAAAVSGAGRFRTFWTINVPIMIPALGSAAIMGFIIGLEYFEAPLILGTAAGVEVISTQIYTYLNDGYPPQFAEASGLATLVLVILIVLLVAQALIQRRKSFETVGGKSGADRPWDLGRWRYVGTVVFVLYAVLALLLPVIQLVLASVQPFFGATSGFSLDNYSDLLDNPKTLEGLRNTGLMAVFAGLVVMLIALTIVFVARHGNRRVAEFILRSTWLPFSMPGPAMALGILWVILSVPLLHGLYGSYAAMFIALVIVAMPIAMRNLEPAVLQVSADLEEAAWISGASKVRAFLAVVARLIIPSFLSGWLLVGILISGNLVIPLMVGSPLMNTVPRMIYDLYATGKGPSSAALSCIYLMGIIGVFLVGLALKWIILKSISRATRTPVDALVSQPDPELSATAALSVPPLPKRRLAPADRRAQHASYPDHSSKENPDA